MKNKKLWILLLAVGIMVTFTGCIPGDGSATPNDPAGFFWGIWHGWIAPISLIGKIFNGNLSIYEINNIGWWYDFGFYAAIISGFGGISLSRKKKKRKVKKFILTNDKKCKRGCLKNETTLLKGKIL